MDLEKFSFPRGAEGVTELKTEFGWRNLQGFGTVKFLLVSPDRD